MSHNGTPSTASPDSTSHSQERNVVGQIGPSYQANIYRPPIYTQYYNQGIPYTYNVPTIPRPSSPSPTRAASSVPVAQPHSEPVPSIPPPPSEEAKPSVPAKRGPGRPRKQPAGGVMSGQGVTARRPTRKGRTPGSQNWIAQDLIALTHFVEADVPLGMNVWKRIEGQYNKEYAIPNDRQERSWDNMRDKWYKVGTHICIR